MGAVLLTVTRYNVLGELDSAVAKVPPFVVASQMVQAALYLLRKALFR